MKKTPRVLVALVIIALIAVPVVAAQVPLCHPEFNHAKADCYGWSADGTTAWAGDVKVHLAIREKFHPDIAYEDEVRINGIPAGGTWEVPETSYQDWMPSLGKKYDWHIRATLVGGDHRDRYGSFGPCSQPVISHMTCYQIVGVWPSAPSGLEGSTGVAHVIRPNATELEVPLSWSGYDGPVAKWTATVTDTNFYQSGVVGTYTIDWSVVGITPSNPGGYDVQNVPFTADLSCDPTAVSMNKLVATVAVPWRGPGQLAIAGFGIVAVVGIAFLAIRRLKLI